jgi:1-acyl-sn-glycerol-3-phosphate acyltransferase
VLLPLSRLRNRRLPEMERAAACQRWLQRAYALLHHFMRVCGLLHFAPRDVDHTVPSGGFVMVANHPSLVDVCALGALYGRMTCVAKTPLFRAPFVGQVLRWCAYLDGGNGDPFSGGLVVQQGIDRIQRGMPVLIFPEGTRSPMGGLGPFKRGAFEIACRAQVPVLPVLIRCEPSALSKGRPWYDIPSSTAFLTLTPLPLVSPDKFGNDATAMASAFEAMYRYHLNLPTNQCEQGDDGNRSRAQATHR